MFGDPESYPIRQSSFSRVPYKKRLYAEAAIMRPRNTALKIANS